MSENKNTIFWMAGTGKGISQHYLRMADAAENIIIHQVELSDTPDIDLSSLLPVERKPWEPKYSGTGGIGSGTKDSKKTSPKLNHTGNGYRSKRKKKSR